MASKYDIFISYRRTGFETANLVSTKLKSKGYRVFFDVEGLRSGKFNEQLFNVIDECRDFVVILPEGALDRCNDQEDWVRKEVCHAMEMKKNIIPVMLAGFSWPAQMPDGMEELQLYQAITASSREYFDMSMERLCSYLKSRPHRKISRVAKFAGIIAGSIVGIFLATLLAFRLLAIPVCSGLAAPMIGHMAELDALACYNEDLLAGWSKYCEKVRTAKSKSHLAILKENYLCELENMEKGLEEITPSDTAQTVLSEYKAFLLSLRGIDAVELSMEPVLAAMYFSNFKEDIYQVRDFVLADNTTPDATSIVSTKKDIEQYSMDGVYYSYLEFLALMPQKAVKFFREIEKEFKFFPKYANLNLSTEEYLAKQYEANDKAQRLINRLSGAIESENMALDELEKKLISLESMANAQLEKQYADILQACRLQDSDELPVQWTKITNLASFMGSVIASEDYIGTPITPDRVYNDLAALLDSFESYSPSSQQWAESAKLFYKEVSLGGRALAGVIIFGIRSDAQSVHRVGDIILTMKGTPVTDYKSLLNAYNQNKSPEVVFLRNENGKLIKHSVKNCGDINEVGCVDLKGIKL